MDNPFDHLGTFLLAVADHTFTLLAGCVVTVILNYVERHTPLKGKMKWQHDLAVVLLFAFFACFQAWHEEYRRAEALQASSRQPSAPPAQVQVNVPPPQVVIERVGGTTVTPDSYVEIVKVQVANDAFRVLQGQPIVYNVYLQQKGPPVQNLRHVANLQVASVDEEEQVAKRFKHLVSSAKAARSNNLNTLSEQENAYFSASTDPLSGADVDALVTGTKFLYLQIWIDWRSRNGVSGNILQCWRQFSPVSKNIAVGRNIDFVTCKTLR